ncbi:MAG: hypothetical protein ACFCGT_22790 [Sandaracinaceae bacterium]
MPIDQVPARSRLLEMGVTVDDDAVRLARAELLRFEASVRAYDEVGVQDPILDRLLIRRGNPSFRYGSRPIALQDQHTLVFWTREGPGVAEPGIVFESFSEHMFYFAHELGHLLEPAADPTLVEAFYALHESSRPGVYDAEVDPPGDFVTEYAGESAVEDFAECFSFVTYARADWHYRRELARVFASRPLLAEKLLLVANAVAAPGWTPATAWLPVVVRRDATPEGPDATDGLVLEHAWIRLERDAAGRARALVLPADLADAGTELHLRCDLSLKRCSARDRAEQPEPGPGEDPPAGPLSI